MIDESIPVLVQLAIGDQHSFCIAKIVNDSGFSYAVPTIIDPAFGRVARIPLDEKTLELIQNAGGGKPIYHRLGTVSLMR